MRRQIQKITLNFSLKAAKHLQNLGQADGLLPVVREQKRKIAAGNILVLLKLRKRTRQRNKIKRRIRLDERIQSLRIRWNAIKSECNKPYAC
jgi:hypothetical protein